MNDTSMQLRDTTADPAPLGLLGFGITTVLLNLHNAGLYELNSMILAMGLCYGGAAQIVAGMMEWKKGNTFGTTAFLSYGFFWWSLVLLVLLPKWGIATATNEQSMAAYLGMWGLFTLVMFLGTLRLSRALQIVFGTLTLLFFLLAYGDFTGAAPRVQAPHRLGRCDLWILRHLHRPRPRDERGRGQNCLAAGKNPAEDRGVGRHPQIAS